MKRPMPFAVPGRRMRAQCLLTSLLCLACAVPAAAQVSAVAADDGYERVQVADPYLELRTGPGRGYPIFHVVDRHQWVAITLRHTDWYQVRADNGKEGWVHRRQLERTLTAAGSARTFRDIVLDDYLSRRMLAGGSWGRFDGEPMLKLTAGYRLSTSLSVDAHVGQVQGRFSGTSFWHVGLAAEPWSDRRLSPFFSVGVGRFSNVPNSSLVSAIRTDANLGQATLGLRWHLSERFVLTADYSLYTAFVADERSIEYRALGAGLAFFF
ncbi:SH3 domain-containing protein [Caldimonas sp.]|uniref:SH3 domain-containing protein n=1 Tax=Caldimonas sp. TaxID=2838790 RepID=UPI00391B8ADF